MAELIGITGAQGAGKTTLLNELKLRGYHVDDFKVSRAVQAELGWKSLEQVTASGTTMMHFQELVLDRKLQHDLQQKQLSDDVLLTERTFADIAAYTMRWAWQLVDEDKLSFDEAAKFNTYYVGRCLEAQLKCYDGVIVLPFMEGVVKFEHDPHRASYSSINSVFDDMVSFMNSSSLKHVPTFHISQATVEDRAVACENFIGIMRSRHG